MPACLATPGNPRRYASSHPKRSPACPQDASKPATIDNLVLLTHAEADEHDELSSSSGGLEALRRQQPELCARVEAVLARAHLDFWWRI